MTPEDASEGLIFFHPIYGNYEAQAGHLFGTVLPAILERNPNLPLGRIAVLYSAAFIGDAVANAAQERDLGIIRRDSRIAARVLSAMALAVPPAPRISTASTGLPS
jgi:DNA helicase-2/ATP-dependent DNA helicase PcrA